MAGLPNSPELDTLEQELRGRGFEDDSPLLAVAMHIAYERGFSDASARCSAA